MSLRAFLAVNNPQALTGSSSFVKKPVAKQEPKLENMTLESKKIAEKEQEWKQEVELAAKFGSTDVDDNGHDIIKGDADADAVGQVKKRSGIKQLTRLPVDVAADVKAAHQQRREDRRAQWRLRAGETSSERKARINVPVLQEGEWRPDPSMDLANKEYGWTEYKAFETFLQKYKANMLHLQTVAKLLKWLRTQREKEHPRKQYLRKYRDDLDCWCWMQPRDHPEEYEVEERRETPDGVITEKVKKTRYAPQIERKFCRLHYH